MAKMERNRRVGVLLCSSKKINNQRGYSGSGTWCYTSLLIDFLGFFNNRYASNSRFPWVDGYPLSSQLEPFMY